MRGTDRCIAELSEEDAEEMVSRVELMAANPDGDWDFSDNDLTALNFVTKRLRAACAEVKSIRSMWGNDLREWQHLNNSLKEKNRLLIQTIESRQPA